MPAPQESAICFPPHGLAASFASIGTSFEALNLGGLRGHTSEC